jgi:hypothetical protein
VLPPISGMDFFKSDMLRVCLMTGLGDGSLLDPEFSYDGFFEYPPIEMFENLPLFIYGVFPPVIGTPGVA